MIHYTRGLAAELGPDNINVNCIAPGWILSSRAIAWGRAEKEKREELEARIALRRLGLPEDCAKVVEFLVTDLSDYVTGQCIPVCGGYVLCSVHNIQPEVPPENVVAMFDAAHELGRYPLHGEPA